MQDKQFLGYIRTVNLLLPIPTLFDIIHLYIVFFINVRNTDGRK